MLSHLRDRKQESLITLAPFRLQLATIMTSVTVDCRSELTRTTRRFAGFGALILLAFVQAVSSFLASNTLPKKWRYQIPYLPSHLICRKWKMMPKFFWIQTYFVIRRTENATGSDRRPQQSKTSSRNLACLWRAPREGRSLDTALLHIALNGM